jgi:hypothetical protein
MSTKIEFSICIFGFPSIPSFRSDGQEPKEVSREFLVGHIFKLKLLVHRFCKILTGRQLDFVLSASGRTKCGEKEKNQE